MIDTKTPGRQLVSAAELLTILWPENSRPSLRWVREMQKRRVLPHYKCGGKVFFCVEQVMQTLEAKNLIAPRHV